VLAATERGGFSYRRRAPIRQERSPTKGGKHQGEDRSGKEKKEVLREKGLFAGIAKKKKKKAFVKKGRKERKANRGKGVTAGHALRRQKKTTGPGENGTPRLRKGVLGKGTGAQNAPPRSLEKGGGGKGSTM